MSTEVRHDESWHVTVHREDGDDWPEQILISGTRTRYMRPETVTFRLTAGEEHPSVLLVFGARIDGSGPAISRFRAGRMPDWLATVIEDARQEHGLTPADIAGP